MDKRRPEAWEILVQALIVLAATAAQVWMMLPPDERMWISLSLRSRSRRVLGVLAAREGRAGMREEIRHGRPGDWSAVRYVTAERLSVLRDKLARS